MVAEMVPDRNARLLFESSHARPPSSQASFQNPTANFTDSIVSLELRATVRPSLSTSLPPHAHMNEYQNTGASPKVWPAVWPIGYPLALSFVPTSRYCCHVFGNSLAPTSSNSDFRYAIWPPTIACGTARQLVPTLQSSVIAG